jgi:hypothetical protein
MEEVMPAHPDRDDPCLGCLRRPSPLCSCCGRAARVAVRAGQCSISYCGQCHQTLLDLRAEALNPARLRPLVYVELNPKPTQPKPARKTSTPARKRTRGKKVAA